MGEALSNGVNAKKTHRKPTKFFKKLYMPKHCQLGLRKLETGQTEERPSDSQNFTVRKQAEASAQL